MATTPAIGKPVSELKSLLPLLQRLDSLLERAIAAAQLAYGTTPDPHQGLHIDEAEVDRLLTREPGAPVFQGYTDPTPVLPLVISPDSPLAQLQQKYDLSDFDLDVVAIALAPELDRRYERLYAYLQDDVRCKRPTVDLALNLLCDDAIEKLERRSHFAPTAPLLHHQLLHLESELTPKPTLLGQELHLDRQIVDFLMGQLGLDARLAHVCELLTAKPPCEPEPELTPRSLHQIASAWQTQQPLRLYFQGRDGLRQRCTALAIAHHLKASMLRVQLSRLVEAKADLEPLLRRIWREADLQNALLYLDGVEAFSPGHRLAYQALLHQVAQTATVILLGGIAEWVAASELPMGVVVLPLPPPNFAQRRQHWQRHLEAIDLALPDGVVSRIDPADLDAIADRFCLTAAQIAEVVAVADNTARWQGVPTALPHLFAAARAQAGHELHGLARKIEPNYTWGDIVLPPDSRQQLEELCRQSQYRHVVYDAWQFDQAFSLGKGINALFSGPPGTGKTMAAEVIAHELQLDLYKIDLSKIVSKYIGETEKNLDRIFTAAANSNAILLFDEADALFGKRSEVQDAHDRYANIEVGYLLQKMEEYEGIALLTSNLRSSLDAAFVRRLRFIIEFPLPDAGDRYHIWQQVWPDSASLAADVNLSLLAQKLEITGAEIRNIALASAFLAATEGQSIGMGHLSQAVRREFQKMGKLLMENVV